MAYFERHRTILWASLLALSLGFSGCSDDDSKSKDGQISGKGLGQVAASPNPVTFETVSLGEETNVTVRISNIGEAALRITNIGLSEHSGAAPMDTDEEFFRAGEGWGPQVLVLEPDEAHTVQVRYKPVNSRLDTGVVYIESNDPNNSSYSIPISTQGLSPKLFSPATVSFPRVTPPGPNASGEDGPWRGAWKITQVQNTGEAPLKISDIKIKGDNSRFSFSIPQPTAEELAEGLSPSPENDADALPEALQELASGESFELRVWFAPDTTNPAEDQLVFSSNDPDSPEYTVNLVGNSGSPCIEVTPYEGVDYALSSIGNVTQKTITVTNCSPSSKLNLESVEITDDGGGAFQIKDGSLPYGLPEESFILDEGGRANFVVTFSPDEEATYNGVVQIKSDDPSQPLLELPLTGRGTDNACPTAIATAKVGPSGRSSTNLQAIPLETVEFDASESLDPDGTIERYEWTILSAPPASSAPVTPAGSVNPTMYMDINGEYVIELKVYDDENTVSCGEPAIINITVRSETDIHIQLTWEGEFGNLSRDVDLHYLHPNSERWGENAGGWGVFWNNKTPDWSVPNGNPTLDRDDLDGPGPENVSHSNLEPITYKVGVHYFSDHGNGPTHATVEIRKSGILTFAARDKFLTTRQFWLVAYIHGLTQSVVEVDTVTEGGLP